MQASRFESGCRNSLLDRKPDLKNKLTMPYKQTDPLRIMYAMLFVIFLLALAFIFFVVI